jgi:hypothetical protein
MTCDRGQCVAALPQTQAVVLKDPNALPTVKVKSVAPFAIETTAQTGNPVADKIAGETQIASVPITELGIGAARLGMHRSEWFSVPQSEFLPSLADDPAGVDARGRAVLNGEVELLALFKRGILCQLSTKSERAATLLGLRAGDAVGQVTQKYGDLSEREPRSAARFPGIYFRFKDGSQNAAEAGPLPETATIEEIIVGTCRE